MQSNQLNQDLVNVNHQTFINKKNILEKNDDILDDLEDIERRNLEFENLGKNTKVDNQYGAYQIDDMLI